MEEPKNNQNDAKTSTPKRNLFIKTFGCQMNFADSDEIWRYLSGRGFHQTENLKEADVALVNTCTVRALAEHKAISYVGRLRKWKAADKNRLLIVTGCAAEGSKAEFARLFPYIDLLFGAKEFESFREKLDNLFQMRGAEFRLRNGGSHSLNSHSAFRAPHLDEVLEENLARGHSSFTKMGSRASAVTIMRGCNYNCSYCIVPAVRGRETNRPVSDILQDVKGRVEEGASEIWLLGQTVNAYRAPEMRGYDFADLLREVESVLGVKTIRFMSPHPFYVNEKLAEAMAECKTVARQIHLPVQSGSTKILKAMNRNYTRESYLKAIGLLRNRVPALTITTDFIVGFPGETGGDFEDTLSLVREVGFDSAFCFKYSPRPGTPATALPDDVPQSVKEERLEILLSLVKKLGRKRARAATSRMQ